MEVIYNRCCGIDIHKDIIVACIITDEKKVLKKFGTMTDDILDFISWIYENHIEVVCMESTGVYWKPIYNLLEDEAFKVLVVNAQHIRGVPGKKTDIKDAEWICDVTRHGLVKNSYIPSRKDRELREITRYRQNITEERSRELNRIQSTLEGANIKMASVITDISGRSGMDILESIVNGITDSNILAAQAKGSLVKKKELLCKSLKGSLGTHQIIMLRHQLNHIRFLSAQIASLDAEIFEKTKENRDKIELMDAIPGIGVRAAERIAAEIGFSMEQFPTASHLCSWAGLVPRNNESAGKRKDSRLKKGNKFVKTILVECALSASKSKKTIFYDTFKRISARRGGKRAIVAIAHKILVIIYSILKNNTTYVEHKVLLPT